MPGRPTAASWPFHIGVRDRLASRDIVCFWDTRSLWPATPSTAAPLQPSKPLSPPLQPLPGALALLHRLGCCAPLSLVHDLLTLTGGRAVEGPLASLASEPGLAALVALRWPAPARIGLVALLLHQLPLADWQPPAGVSSSQLRDALTAASRASISHPRRHHHHWPCCARPHA